MGLDMYLSKINKKVVDIEEFRTALGKPRLFNSRDERVYTLEYVSKSKVYIPKDIFFDFNNYMCYFVY